MKLPIDMFTIPILFKASSSIVRDGILLKFDDDEVFTRTPLVPTVAGGVKGERVETNPPRGAGVQCKE